MMYRRFIKRKKPCPFKKAGFKTIDYKDVETLKNFITERGKIVPRRISCSLSSILSLKCGFERVNNTREVNANGIAK